MIAKNIMKTKVITVSPSAPITEAALLMRDEDIGALIVVDDTEKPVGIMTDRDIVISALAENKDPGELIVEDIMTRQLHMVQEDTNVFDILRVLSKNSIRRVPVTRKGKLAGIISVDDIVVVVATELANLASALTGGISRTL
jgi:CBS domain-containing protein